MRIFVFLHVLSMFFAVAISGGIELFLMRIARSRDVRTIRRVFALHQELVRFVPIVFMIGLAFGVIAIFANDFNPFAGWLLLAYPLFVAGILIGVLGVGPWAEGVIAAASASGDDEPSSDLDAAIASTRGRNSLILFWIVVAAIVFVMVVKPLS